jgi:hypothetical protein
MCLFRCLHIESCQGSLHICASLCTFPVQYLLLSVEGIQMKIPFYTIADVDLLVFATGLAHSEGTKKKPSEEGLT